MKSLVAQAAIVALYASLVSVGTNILTSTSLRSSIISSVIIFGIIFVILVIHYVKTTHEEYRWLQRNGYDIASMTPEDIFLALRKRDSKNV